MYITLILSEIILTLPLLPPITQPHKFFYHDQSLHEIQPLVHKGPSAIRALGAWTQRRVDLSAVVQIFDFLPQSPDSCRYDGVERVAAGWLL